MDDFIQGLEYLTKWLQRFFERLVTSFLDFPKRALEWLIIAVRRIGTNLIRLSLAIGKLLIVIFKLGLFYLPGIIAILAGVYNHNVWLISLGASWIVLITLVGFVYKKRIRENQQSKE